MAGDETIRINVQVNASRHPNLFRVLSSTPILERAGLIKELATAGITMQVMIGDILEKDGSTEDLPKPKRVLSTKNGTKKKEELAIKNEPSPSQSTATTSSQPKKPTTIVSIGDSVSEMGELEF